MATHRSAQVVTRLRPAWRRGAIADAKLSVRERDCLQWAAAGKSDWDISLILGISRHTVDAHMRKAMRKLDSVSRTQAVAKALVSHQISL